MKHTIFTLTAIGLLASGCQTTEIISNTTSLMAAQQQANATNTQPVNTANNLSDATSPTHSNTAPTIQSVDATLSCEDISTQLAALDLQLSEDRKAAGITGKDVALDAAGSAVTYEAAKSGLLSQNPNVGRAMNMFGSMNKKRKENRRKEALAAVQEGEMHRAALSQSWTEKKCVTAEVVEAASITPAE